MTDRKQTLKAKLHDARSYLDSVLDRVEDRWEMQVYSDGLQWTVRQIVIHLADAGRGHNNQAMNIAVGKDIIPEDFDIQRYNRRVTEKSAEKTTEAALQELRDNRAALMEWLDTVDDSALDNKGRHASLQIMTVEEILLNQANHEHGHATDIENALKQQAPS